MAKHSKEKKHPRLILATLLLTIGFIAVAVRLVVIQGFQREIWHKRAQREHEKSFSIEAERGAIYDRRGNVLAMNVETPSIYAVPAEVRDPVATSKALATFLNGDPKALAKKLKDGKNFVWLGRKIEPDKAADIEKRKMDGIGFVMESQRFYPKRALFGHLLGFAGIDNHGLEGIELKYDDQLRGETGWIVVERDAYGKSIFPKGFDYIAPSRGKDLHLTVDEVIQYISERELDRVIEKTHAKGGTVIVMDPWTGEILSMAVRPFFNPNALGSSHPSEWRNRAITDAYEPGSTFKIITASAALEEKVVSPDEIIDCEQGAFAVAGTVIHDHTPSGAISFRQVIERSSNIGTVKVAERLGEARLAAYVNAFGFGKKLGIDLKGEAPGLVREQRQWSKRSLASIAIGQEIGVTPLQMVTAASVIANGGYLMTPHLIQEVKERDVHNAADRVVSRSQLSARRRVLSEETAREVSRILEGVVSKAGTAPRAAIPGYTVAGKTGTAQKIDPATGRYSANSYVSSFVGFVPAEDPVITILVMVDEPEGESWGGTIAAPVFSTIGAEALRYLKTPPRSAPFQGFLTASLEGETIIPISGAVAIKGEGRRLVEAE